MSEMVKIDLPVEEIRAYCERQPIMRLSDFGKEYPDMLRPDTEIGLLVEYLPGARITYIDMARQELELGRILGDKVDLRTPNELDPHFRQQILEGATLVFAQNSRE